MTMGTMDQYDNRILEVIRDNARLSYSEIGEKVGLSRVSVHKRMDRLEEMGVIEGYYTKMNTISALEGRQFIVTIVMEPQVVQKVLDVVATMNSVRKVYMVTGESRLQAEGIAPDRGTYEACMRRVHSCSKIDGVKKIVVQDVQYTLKDTDRGIDYVRDECEGTEDH